MGQFKCWACGKLHDRHETMRQNDEAKPKDGDVALCIKCGEWNMFSEVGGEKSLRQPTDKELEDIATDEECIRARAGWVIMDEHRRNGTLDKEIAKQKEEKARKDKYRDFTISSVTAVVARDEDDNSEGIVGVLQSDGNWMPLIASDKVREEQLRDMAAKVRQQGMDRPMYLVKFTTREFVGDIE